MESLEQKIEGIKNWLFILTVEDFLISLIFFTLLSRAFIDLIDLIRYSVLTLSLSYIWFSKKVIK